MTAKHIKNHNRTPGFDGTLVKGVDKNHRPQRRGRICESTSELISAFMTTAAANFATLTEREIAEAEQVTTINVKTGEQTA